MTDQQLAVEPVPVDSLENHPDNPRKGNVQRIKEGLERYGQYAPLVAQTSTRRVLIGNHRLIAMRELGWTHAAVHWRDVDDAEALRLLAFDNRSSDDATYDNDALLAVLKGLGDLDGTGYQPADLDELARVTGALAADNTGFLGGDDPAGDDGGDGGGGQDGDRAYFQLSYPVTEEQRQVVLRALKAKREKDGLDTSVEALVALCQAYVDEGE